MHSYGVVVIRGKFRRIRLLVCTGLLAVALATGFGTVAVSAAIPTAPGLGPNAGATLAIDSAPQAINIDVLDQPDVSIPTVFGFYSAFVSEPISPLFVGPDLVAWTALRHRRVQWIMDSNDGIAGIAVGRTVN